MRRSGLLVALGANLCAGLGGCVGLGGLAGLGPPMQPGEVYSVIADSEVTEMNPGQLATIDPRIAHRGSTGTVLPTGATVKIVDYVTTAGSEHKPLSVWQYVTVTDSPIHAQIGWTGWVHHKTLGHEVSRGPGLASHRVAYDASLCPRPTKITFQCTLAVAPGLAVRMLGCEHEGDVAFAHIELWSSDGSYATGYLPATSIEGKPCI